MPANCYQKFLHYYLRALLMPDTQRKPVIVKVFEEFKKINLPKDKNEIHLSLSKKLIKKVLASTLNKDKKFSMDIRFYFHQKNTHYRLVDSLTVKIGEEEKTFVISTNDTKRVYVIHNIPPLLRKHIFFKEAIAHPNRLPKVIGFDSVCFSYDSSKVHLATTKELLFKEMALSHEYSYSLVKTGDVNIYVGDTIYQQGQSLTADEVKKVKILFHPNTHSDKNVLLCAKENKWHWLFCRSYGWQVQKLWHFQKRGELR